VITFRAGDATVKMSDDLRRMVDHVARGVAPAAVAVLEAQVEDVASEARADWPVGNERTAVAERGRAHSRDLVVDGVEVTSDGIRAFVGNGAEYARYIKSSKNGLRGKSPWQELIRKPMLAAVVEVVDQLGPEIKRLAATGGR
jgi:hypothetical protein